MPQKVKIIAKTATSFQHCMSISINPYAAMHNSKTFCGKCKSRCTLCAESVD